MRGKRSRGIWVALLLSLACLSGCGAGPNVRPAGEAPAGPWIEKSVQTEEVFLRYDKAGTPARDETIRRSVGLHYEEAGPAGGEPVLLVHGFGSSSYTWHKIMPALAAAGYRVVAVDLKGFGFSEKPADGDYSVGALEEELDAFLGVLGIDHANVIGNSLGGCITAILSIRHPERVKRMVLIDAGGYPTSLPPIVRLLRLPGGAAVGKLLFAKWLVRWNLKQVFHDKDRLTERDVDEYYDRLATENAVEAQVAVARGIDFAAFTPYAEALRQNDKPALLIWGKEDVWVPLEGVGNRYRGDLKGSHLVVIDSCGHVPQEERPAEVLALLLDFLAGKEIQDSIVEPEADDGG